jgi:hypothetical protein
MQNSNHPVMAELMVELLPKQFQISGKDVPAANVSS